MITIMIIIIVIIIMIIIIIIIIIKIIITTIIIGDFVLYFIDRRLKYNSSTERLLIGHLLEIGGGYLFPPTRFFLFTTNCCFDYQNKVMPPEAGTIKTPIYLKAVLAEIQLRIALFATRSRTLWFSREGIIW